MTETNLAAWCERHAAGYREYEHVEMAAAPTPDERDYALVEWTVRVLGNPDEPESREVVRILAERHGLPAPTAAEAVGCEREAGEDR